MTQTKWTCKSCNTEGAGVPASCPVCGSRDLVFEEIELGQRCEVCGKLVDEGWRDCDLCECGRQLCRRCLRAHERFPVLCAGRRCA